MNICLFLVRPQDKAIQITRMNEKRNQILERTGYRQQLLTFKQTHIISAAGSKKRQKRRISWRLCKIMTWTSSRDLQNITIRWNTVYKQQLTMSM